MLLTIAVCIKKHVHDNYLVVVYPIYYHSRLGTYAIIAVLVDDPKDYKVRTRSYLVLRSRSRSELQQE